MENDEKREGHTRHESVRHVEWDEVDEMMNCKQESMVVCDNDGVFGWMTTGGM